MRYIVLLFALLMPVHGCVTTHQGDEHTIKQLEATIKAREEDLRIVLEVLNGTKKVGDVEVLYESEIFRLREWLRYERVKLGKVKP